MRLPSSRWGPATGEAPVPVLEPDFHVTPEYAKQREVRGNAAAPFVVSPLRGSGYHIADARLLFPISHVTHKVNGRLGYERLTQGDIENAKYHNVSWGVRRILKGAALCNMGILNRHPRPLHSTFALF